MITPALMTGAFADRFRFKPYLIFIVLWLLYLGIFRFADVWKDGFGLKINEVFLVSGLMTVLLGSSIVPGAIGSGGEAFCTGGDVETLLEAWLVTSLGMSASLWSFFPLFRRTS